MKRKHKHHGRRGNFRGHKNKTLGSTPISTAVKVQNFVFWFGAYLLVIVLFGSLLKNLAPTMAPVGFYLIMGYTLAISGRIIYSAKYKKHFRFSGVVSWGLLYSLVFGLINYSLELAPPLNIPSFWEQTITYVIIGLIFTIVIKYLHRMKLDQRSRKNAPWFMRAPSQILSGIFLFVGGILVFRFSHVIFIGWLNWPEGVAWSWLIGLIFLVAGILTLVAWWRNNVLNFNFGLKIH